MAPRIATPSPNATQDRPTYPPRVQRTEILFDPFDDIVPREKVVVEDPVAKRPKRKEKKNLALLSFGEEAAEEERDLSKVGSPSPEP